MWRYGIIIRRCLARAAGDICDDTPLAGGNAGVACHIHMQSNGGEGEPHGRIIIQPGSCFHNKTKGLRTTPPFTSERTFR